MRLRAAGWMWLLVLVASGPPRGGAIASSSWFSPLSAPKRSRDAHAQLRERCRRSCRGRLAGGEWGVFNVTEKSSCLVNGMYGPTAADAWSIPGVNSASYPGGYCSRYTVPGCTPWRAGPRWQVHQHAEVVVETFALLGLKHIRFAGDSVSRQHYYTLMRELEPARAALPVRVEVPAATLEEHTYGDKYAKPVTLYAEDRFESSRTPGAQLTVSFLYTQSPLGNLHWRYDSAAALGREFLERVLPCSSPQVREALLVPGFDTSFFNRTASACEPVDVLVLNFGMHYQYTWLTPYREQLRELIVPDHRALMETLAKHPAMRRVYRELAPVHGDGKAACKAAATAEEALTKNGISGTLAREVLGERTAQQMRAAGVAWLEVFDATRSQWQDHASPADCVHWRIPGPINVWNEALLDTIFCQEQS